MYIFMQTYSNAIAFKEKSVILIQYTYCQIQLIVHSPGYVYGR